MISALKGYKANCFAAAAAGVPFLPTCSIYSMEAIQTVGHPRGGFDGGVSCAATRCIGRAAAGLRPADVAPVRYNPASSPDALKQELALLGARMQNSGAMTAQAVVRSSRRVISCTLGVLRSQRGIHGRGPPALLSRDRDERPTRLRFLSLSLALLFLGRSQDPSSSRLSPSGLVPRPHRRPPPRLELGGRRRRRRG